MKNLTETLAGITTFLSIAYILVVNPIILSQSGMAISSLRMFAVSSVSVNTAP